MKVIDIHYWLDGGSITIECDDRIFFIDNRLEAVIQGKLYCKHRAEKEKYEVTINDPLRDELKVALDNYKNEHYQSLVDDLRNSL